MRVWIVAACMVIGACSKSTPSGGEGNAAQTKPAEAGVVASGEGGAGGDAGSGTGTGTGTGTGSSAAYAGKYSIAVGTMYVGEKDAPSVKFKNDDSKMLGDGEIKLEVDGRGIVSGGTEGGPLGASVISGASDGKTLNASVRRKDPSDEGLTGTIEAKIEGDAITGTMKLAEANAAVVRVGKLDVKKK